MFRTRAWFYMMGPFLQSVRVEGISDVSFGGLRPGLEENVFVCHALKELHQSGAEPTKCTKFNCVKGC